MTRVEHYQLLRDGAIIITSTHRLSREIIAGYDQYQIAEGASAWSSAEVLPMDAWLARSWEFIATTLELPPLLLNDNQLEVLWQQLIESDITKHEQDSKPLWNIHSSAKAGIAALKIIRSHAIKAEQFAHSDHPDHRCFARWMTNYSNHCKQQNWIDRFQLADQIAARCDLLQTQHIVLTGFDEINPQTQELVDALSYCGSQIQINEPIPSIPNSLQAIAFESEQNQWHAAGRWAREILLCKPSSRIGIVAPDLTKNRNAIEYGLKQALCPTELLTPGDSSNLPYHLSLGEDIASHPITSQGLHLLEVICSEKISIDDIGSLVLSPFITNADVESTERSELAVDLPRILPFKTSIRRLVKEIEYQWQREQTTTCAILVDCLNQCFNLLDTAPTKDSSANWAKIFNQLLSILGWPGKQRFASDEFQWISAFREQLNQFAGLDLVTGKISLATALILFRRKLSSKIFQIESKGSQVQVLGIRESAGLEFDYIWFGGLIEPDWPPGTRPNPFIPIALQRAHGVENASVDVARNRAIARQQNLFVSSPQIVLSRQLADGDVELEGSPLVNEYCWSRDNQSDTDLSLMDVIHQQRLSPELILEKQGPAFQTDTRASGGTGLIAMQGYCPRGAFARYRLGMEQLAHREQGLDAAERGMLMHRVLELAWKKINNSSTLHKLSETELLEIIHTSSVDASGRFKIHSGCGEQFFANQIQWITRLAMEWFELEKQRDEPFSVVGSEQKSKLILAGLELSFSIDRIDQFADGRLALIDYKTGSQNSVADWFEARSQSPQLPLYALTQDNPVAVIAYAQVRAGECSFSGLSDNLSFAGSEAKAIKVIEISKHRNTRDHFDDATAIQAFWRDNLQSVAAEFAAGEFGVDPSEQGLCNNCPTPSFCRSGDRISDNSE